MKRTKALQVGICGVILFGLLCGLFPCAAADGGPGAGCSLATLSLSSGTLSPAFSSDITSYSAEIYDTAEVIITPVAADTNAVVAVDGKACAPGFGSVVTIKPGRFTVTITVSLPSGTEKNYYLSISSQKNETALLSRLTVSQGALSPSFSPDQVTYRDEVDYSVDSITVTPWVSGNQSIRVNGIPCLSGSGCTQPLSVGANTLMVIVSDPSGHQKSYTVTVTRAARQDFPDGDSGGLSALVLSAGALSPSFSPAVYQYSVSVENDISNLYLSAVPKQASAQVTVNGSKTSSVSLHVGVNPVTVSVSGSGGVQTVYTISVLRKYNTQITVLTQNAAGAYCAQIPDFAAYLGEDDAFTFRLGGDTVLVPATVLKQYSGPGLSVSRGDASPSDLRLAQAAFPDNGSIAGGVSLVLSGGRADSACAINARVTLQMKAGIKAALKEGVPQVLYYNSVTGKLEDTGAYFDMSAGTAFFTAARSGIYVLATVLSGTAVKYTVAADSGYTQESAGLCFHVSVRRAADSRRLGDAKLLVVTTLSTGAQTYYLKDLTGESTVVTVPVNQTAVKSAVYLISGTFDGSALPKSYALTQFVGA